MAKRQQADVWSPYGHERARRALLAQRRAQVILAAIAIAVAYAVFLAVTLEEQDGVGSSSQEIPIEEQKPITVSVTPGRMDPDSFVNGNAEAPQGQNAPSLPQHKESAVMQVLKPFLSLIAPLVGAFWLLSRVGTSARGKLAELNLGVYKGAMPYELHTARGHKKVFTYREVDAHVFGKVREDFLFGSYLGAPPLAVRRMLGEAIDSAHVSELKRGGARVTVRPAEAPQPWKARLAAHAKAMADRVPGRDPRAARLRALKRQGRTGGT